MTEPHRGVLSLRRRRGWLVERGLFLASVGLLVASAAVHPQQGSGSLVFAAFVCASAVGLAWFRDDVSTCEVLVFALLARLIAFPLLPSLSDDGFRYVWDGWLQARGVNPYLFRPADSALGAFQSSEVYSRLNSSDYYSVYPPASQVVFWLGSIARTFGWESSWYLIKGVFVAIEVLGLWAASRVVSPRALLLYAWHPLVIIEGAGQAHTETAMVGFLLMAVVAYRRERPLAAVAALTVAGWFKLYPLALLPFLFRRVGWKYAGVALVVSLGLVVPFAHPAVLGHIVESLELYVRRFEFNAGPYYLLKRVGWWWSGEDVSKTLGPALRIAFLVSLGALYAQDARSRWPLVWVWVLVLGVLWATATTVHPWYLLGVLALLPFTVDNESPRAASGAGFHAAAWLWLTLASLVTYLFYSVGSTPYWVAVWVGWGGWALLLTVAGARYSLPVVMRRRAEAKWRWLRLFLENPRHVLDLGAGEGYVGEAVARDTGASVVLADVIDFNQTELPLVRYGGQRLPFAAGAFDTTLLVFVLHHSDDPSEVLAEAKRVTSGRVVVLESVVENRTDLLWLTFADRLANRVRSGGRMEEEDLRFGTVAVWRERFAALGFDVVAEERRGRWLHKRHLFVLEI